MARKSNETLLMERLAKISECPFDIFEFLTPKDELFDLIQLAEGKDADAVLALTERLGQICIKEKKSSNALVYLCEKGLALGIINVALTMISYSLALNEHFSLSLDALKLINEKASEEIIESLKGTELELYARKLVHDISKGEKTEKLDAIAALLPIELFRPEHIYLCSYKLRRGECKKEAATELLKHIELEGIVALPSFCGKEFTVDGGKILNARELADTLNAMRERHADNDWRDYWIRILYEFAEYYLDKDYTAIAGYVIKHAQSRMNVKNRNAHALAWTRYMLFSENAILSAEERYSAQAKFEQLENACMFEGMLPDFENADIIKNVMHEAIYTSEKEARNTAVYIKSLGSVIRHENKRFLMECELSGHSKRGHKHTWEFKMSMPKEFVDKKSPTFENFKVECVNPFITRGGVTLERDKTSSQIICRSEIKFGEAAHPFLIDIILDITYISSVKCTLGELKIRRIDEDDKYITYTCQLLLS